MMPGEATIARCDGAGATQEAKMLPRNERMTSAAGWGILLMVSLMVAAPVAAQEVIRPDWITVERVEAGLRLYHTKGACATCHGELGVGTPDGPQLVNGWWKLGPGTDEWLRHITRHAGWGSPSRTGDPQPMRGPTVLDSAEVSAVAAYVWNISRGRVAATTRP
jgi:mono/diheme cytochrome c family protein